MGIKRLCVELKERDVKILVKIDGNEHVYIEQALRGLGIKAIETTSILLNESSLNKSQLSIYLTDLDGVQYVKGAKVLKQPLFKMESAVLTLRLDEERFLTNVITHTDQDLKDHFKAGYEACKAELSNEDKETKQRGRPSGKKNKA